ncbi:feruloyl-CoA synthase [Wenxinia marina]|uniref:Trans-feruloyl-CoA synthase n=1 Tax=Wenxinia marina DSM 24838 TaxID=1123501 RepID=A0A0D0NQ58_9RHOB|nr:feruloyl-CoA synthase [Wenxinia marina]KIQ70420.1 trans-feruloyl-CoA synthase [Wenxinia marina DSM 24838]GGL53317.1 feruloyl-CoA synthase [Wenxinia marina]
MTERDSDPLFWTPDLRVETRPDGVMLVSTGTPLADYPRSMNVRLMEWAEAAPDRVWLAERDGEDGWRRVTYAEAARAVRGIGAALVERGLSPERPLLILSGNSVAHALMAMGAQHVGVPSAAIAPAYALAEDLGKLRSVVEQLTPGMVFAEEAAPFLRAVDAELPGIPMVTVRGDAPGRERIAFDALAATEPTDAMEQAHAATGPDTVAKFLFTSGTTGRPKAVIQTQKMICANQQTIRQCWPFLREPPVVIDWAPWNHTASGNKVFYMVLNNGGTYHIDDGRPTPRDIGKTVRNLREVAPTWYFNVPIGYQMLLDTMEADAELRHTFFSRLKMLFYAGAGMSQPIWDRLTKMAEDEVEGGVLLATGLGSTETAPFALICTTRQERSGNVGIPADGVTLKLVPAGDRWEARLAGPGITPGYWRDPELTAEAFDEEGFYKLGDALSFHSEGRPEDGFHFAGRLAENFKLATGTWVAVGELRAKLCNELGGLASDAVIAGEGREALGALVVPDWSKVRGAAEDTSAEGAALLTDPGVKAAVAARLAAHAKAATGSASRVTRVMLLAEPLSFEAGEVTDKGSVNQRAVLRNRQDLVDALWSDDDPRVIRAEDAA